MPRLILEDRPAPPAELTADEARLWFAAVSVMPPGYFDIGASVLAIYCQATVLARQLADALAAADPADPAAYRQLATMRAREERTAMQAARALGLTAAKSGHGPRWQPAVTLSTLDQPWRLVPVS